MPCPSQEHAKYAQLIGRIKKMDLFAGLVAEIPKKSARLGALNVGSHLKNRSILRILVINALILNAPFQKHVHFS